MTVSAVGKELSTQTKNICDLASCPMAANSYFSFNYTQALPITIPPLVEADVVIAGYDSFNVNLMCLDIRFGKNEFQICNFFFFNILFKV